MSAAAYTGSLLTKRKPELVEIAQALNIDEPEARISDLVKSIQSHLETNEDSLKNTAMWKGLYTARRAARHSTENGSEVDGPIADAKAMLTATATRSRKSLGKALEKVVDAANIPLPDSPVSFAKVQDTASKALTTTQDTMSSALVPAQNISRDLTSRFHRIERAYPTLTKYIAGGQHRVDYSVRKIRDYLSTPQKIVTAALFIEFFFLLRHVVQFYDHTVFWSPPGGENGTIASLVHTMYSWLPNTTINFRLPELLGWRSGTELWPAVAWWVSITVIPALTASTIFSFVPQKGISHNTGHNTRYAASHPPTPTFDPLTFAIFRLAILLWPLTSAAPSAIVDGLEISGNLQGRALGAGLLVALIVADRLGKH